MSQIQGSVRGAENYGLISSYGIYDRDIHQKLFKKVPRASALSWMRAVEGRMSKRKTRRDVYDFYEEGQFFKASAKIFSTTTSGSDVLVTLSPGDHQNSGTESFPVMNQEVIFEDESVGIVKAIDITTDNAHIITIEPVNATENVINAAVVSSTLTFFSNAQKEKSTSTTSRIPKFNKISNGLQTFREIYEVTDFAEQNDVEFKYKGQNKVYVKGTDDASDAFAIQEELGLLVGKSDDGNLTSTAKTIKGLIPQITDSGKTMEYFGAPDMTTFDDAILILNKSFGDHEYIVGQGLDVNLKLKNALKEFVSAETYSAFGSGDGARQQALNFNFKSVSIEPYSFHFQTWDILSHSDSLGAGNMPFKDMLIFMPTGETKNPNKQAGENDYEPYVQIAYADPGGSAQENKGDYKLWETGANARSGATDDEMTRKIHWYSRKGIEVRTRNKFLVVRKGQ